VNHVGLATDGSGGAVISWRDGRNVNWDIYAQRVNASGVVQWTVDGVSLCTDSDNQSEPAIASDGAGGAIVSWQDSRSAAPGLYAQRVNALGSAQWTAGGVALSIVDNIGELPENNAPLAVGSGGAIVAWSDHRDSAVYPDIYAQRVDGSGVVQWTTNGVVLCAADKDQIDPVIVSDGADGAIVAWADWRSGTDYDVYAQRVTASGTIGTSEVPLTGVATLGLGLVLGALGLMRRRNIH
jgi:hypothetical protein